MTLVVPLPAADGPCTSARGNCVVVVGTERSINKNSHVFVVRPRSLVVRNCAWVPAAPPVWHGVRAIRSASGPQHHQNRTLTSTHNQCHTAPQYSWLMAWHPSVSLSSPLRIVGTPVTPVFCVLENVAHIAHCRRQAAIWTVNRQCTVYKSECHGWATVAYWVVTSIDGCAESFVVGLCALRYAWPAGVY